MKYLMIRVLALAITLMTAGCAVTHHYDEYVGRVVDAETKKPLQGAAVLVVYYTQHWGPAGSVTYYADAQEAVTDKNGEFKIPSIRLYTFQFLAGWEGHPSLTIFKPGYGCYPQHKYATPQFDYGSLPPNQHVSIELPNVQHESLDQRLRNAACLPSPSVPENKFRKIRELTKLEYTSLGN